MWEIICLWVKFFQYLPFYSFSFVTTELYITSTSVSYGIWIKKKVCMIQDIYMCTALEIIKEPLYKSLLFVKTS